MAGARPFLEADFPGYAEAVARENLVRGAACLGVNEKICGLEVRPLTAWHYRWLAMVHSPFLAPKMTAELLATKPEIVADALFFLWIVSPMFVPGAKERRHWWQRKTPRDRFNAAFAPVMQQPVDRVCREILEYIDEAFIDAEPPPANDKSFYEFEVMVAAELHEHYGYRVDFWNAMPAEKNPIHVPLKLMFQFRKLRKIACGQVVENNSDRFLSAGLLAMNDRDRRLREYEQELATAPAKDWNGSPRGGCDVDYDSQSSTLNSQPATLN